MEKNTDIYIYIYICMYTHTHVHIAYIHIHIGFPGGASDKESTANAGDTGTITGVGKNSWRRKWQPTPIFLPG